jgi:polysaccharide export outer membrane protein
MRRKLMLRLALLAWVVIMYKQNLLVPAVCLFMLLLAGCAGGGGAARTSGASSPAASAAESASYLVGPSDSLQIFVWDHAELTTTVAVRPDGRISTPLVEDLQAGGKTPTQLARDIEKVLSQYVRTPVVTVIVQGFVGQTAQQIRVVGQAVKPRTLQYRDGMTVLDVMIDVGGLSEFAGGNRARIVRNVNGKSTEIRVRLKDLLNDGKIDQNVHMLPGDVLIIPQSAF